MVFIEYKVFAVHRYDPAGTQDAEQFMREELVMDEKLVIVRAVPHVSRAIVINVESGERRRIDREVNRVARHLANDIDAISMDRLPCVAMRLVQAAELISHDGNLAE